MKSKILIVGLGNPNENSNNILELINVKNISSTKHNVGFMFVDKIIKKFNVNMEYRQSIFADIGFFNFENFEIILLKPQTFINDSGISIKLFLEEINILNDNIFIVYDDIYKKIGNLILKFKSSSGGHNGLKNIINNIEQSFYSLKFGIDFPNDKNILNHVLSEFEETDKLKLFNLFDNVIENFSLLLNDKQKFMNKFNNRSF